MSMATRKNIKSAKRPTSKSRKKKALGKGLDALIPDMSTLNGPAKGIVSENLFQCDIELIQPNPFQLRFRFSEEELAELAESIKSQGILQPLLVRARDFGYELVAGERRLRAAKLADLETVPVMVKEISDAQMLEICIVENIQRENLNPMEEAEGYHRLMTEFQLTQEQAAERVQGQVRFFRIVFKEGTRTPVEACSKTMRPGYEPSRNSGLHCIEPEFHGDFFACFGLKDVAPFFFIIGRIKR